MNSGQSLWFGVVTALGASLCCVGPLVLVSLGLGGAWISGLSKLEPLRPALVAVTLVLLVWAWRQLYRVAPVCEPDERCADPKVRKRQRLIFWVVATAVLLMLAFPWYAFLFF